MVKRGGSFIYIQLIYFLILSFLGILAVVSFWSIRKIDVFYTLRIKKNRYDQFIDYVKRRIDEKEVNQLFQQSGLRITAIQYQISRYIIFSVWVVLINISHYFKGGTYPFFQLFVIFLIFLLTLPTSLFLGKRTIFKYFIDLLIENYRGKQNAEIFQAMSQLKNIVIARKDTPLGSDFILDQIRKFTKTTRPVFNRMIALWSLGKKDQACDYFEEAIQTREAAELANLFRKLDDLNPHELHQQIILLQEMIKRERETRKLKANENKGNLVYFIVISTSMVILINFVVVVYYLEMMKQLKFMN